MAGHIPEHIITQVQAATDIVSLISQYVELKKAGKDFVGLCPFHKEKSPSFTVSREKQLFHCFGCKEGGSAVRFLMLHDRFTFPEAVRHLAQQVGIEIPETSGRDPREEAAARSERESIYTALTQAASFFAAQLSSSAGTHARAYLEKRKINENTIKVWHLGYSPNSWDSLCRHLTGQGYSPQTLEKAGLVSPRNNSAGHYDRFRDRLMFPIYDVRDRGIAFGARTLKEGDNPKYLNSPETPLFNKSATLYGLNHARTAIAEKGFAVVVEGYTDVLMAHQYGVSYVVATLGTALTKTHIDVLRRYVQRVVLVYDADEAGEAASDRSIDLFLEEDFDVSIATLAQGLDPCDFLLQYGANAFEDRVQQAHEILAFKLERARARHDFSRLDGQARATDEVLTLVPKIHNEVKQNLFIQRAASELRIPETALRARMRSLTRRERSHGTAEATPAAPRRASASEIAQRDVLAYLLKFPSQSPSVFHNVAIDEFSEPVCQTIYQALRDLHETEGTFDTAMVMSALEARGPEDPAGRMAAQLLAEQDEENLARRLEGSLEWFSKQRKQKEVSELKHQIREAQSRGDSARVKELMRQAQANMSPSSGLEVAPAG